MDVKKTKTMESVDIDTQKKEELVLRKHVGLIHCENKLTLVQRKICNILLFNALDKINDQEIHQISLRQLCSMVGYNSNDIDLIKTSIKKLISTVMEWNLLEDSKFLNEIEKHQGDISWNASALLAGASIKSGVVSYSYSPQIKSVLSTLDIYGQINLFVQAKFNSSYSLVLYENCVRFKKIKQTSWFPIRLFRSLMGISQEKYLSFKELKRNVINVATKEINDKSDIMIEPEYKKVGRNIVAIQFSIEENEGYKPAFKKRPDRQIEMNATSLLEVIVNDFGLSQTQASDILGNYKQDYILEKIAFVKTKKNIDHPGAYLLAALKNDYKLKKGEVVISEKRVGESSYIRESQAASEIASLKNKYMVYKASEYESFVRKQPRGKQSDVYDQFELHLKNNPVVLRFYKKSGVKSPFVMQVFIQFIEAHFSDLIGEYLSFDDYLVTAEEVC